MFVSHCHNDVIFVHLDPGLAAAVVMRGTVPIGGVRPLAFPFAIVGVILVHDQIFARVFRIHQQHHCEQIKRL